MCDNFNTLLQCETAAISHRPLYGGDVHCLLLTPLHFRCLGLTFFLLNPGFLALTKSVDPDQMTSLSFSLRICKT